MTGIAFHVAVAEIDPQVARRFVFMSGDVLNAELREFADTRGITLLAKPFDIESVDRTVARILGPDPGRRLSGQSPRFGRPASS